MESRSESKWSEILSMIVETTGREVEHMVALNPVLVRVMDSCKRSSLRALWANSVRAVLALALTQTARSL